MTKNEYIVRIHSIMKFLESKLQSGKARYFDPQVVLEYFERFTKIRSSLKKQYRESFEDLKDRELPVASKTSDFNGRGYIVRMQLEQLYEDCRYAMELLEVLDLPASTPFTKEPDVNEDVDGESKEIFISHASKDQALVQLFVERVLRIGMDITSDRIFCTSLDGMNLQHGEDFREQIRKALQRAKVVIFIITPNYKASEVCQNEMGAAWYSGKAVIPLIIEPITFSSVGVLMQPKQIPRISDSKALSKVRDDIIRHLGLNATKTDMWDAGKEGFLAGLDATLKTITFPIERKPDEVSKIEQENQRLREQIGLTGVRLAQLQQKYDEVVKSKDAAAVKAVEEKFDNRTQLEKFEELTKSVWAALKGFPPIIQAMILCEHFRQPYSPPANDYVKELQTAERRNLISFDGEQFSINEGHKDVRVALTTIKKLEKFINEADADFPDLYVKDFKSPLEIDNEEFWEEHFALTVPN